MTDKDNNGNMFSFFIRMNPQMAVNLTDMLEPYLPNDARGVHPSLQVLAIVRFLAEGNYQKSVAENMHHPMSQPTFSSIYTS